MQEEPPVIPPSHRLTDRTFGGLYNGDFKLRDQVAIHDILRFKAAPLNLTTVAIAPDGMARFDLSANEAHRLGLGNAATSVHDSSPDFRRPGVGGTTGLAVWLTPEFIDAGRDDPIAAFNASGRPAIEALCSTLSAKHQLPVYPAFLPIANGVANTPGDLPRSVAGSVLVLMTDSAHQNCLLTDVREDLLRHVHQLKKMRDSEGGKRPPGSNAR